jgi:hypothetical protein
MPITVSRGLKIYKEPASSPLVIVQAGGFKFYTNSFPKEMPAIQEGEGCRGSGRLLLRSLFVGGLSTSIRGNSESALCVTGDQDSWAGLMPGAYNSKCLAGVAFFFGVEEFGEARVFLEEGEVFVVAGVEAVFGFQFDGYF